MKDNKELIYDNGKDIQTLPTIAMRGLVAFPNQVMHFDVARAFSIAAVSASLQKNKQIFLVAQNDTLVHDPSIKDVFKIGVVAEIKQVLKTPNNVVRLVIEGKYRAKIVENFVNDKYLEVGVKRIPNSRTSKKLENDIVALVRTIKDIFEQYLEVVPQMPKELVTSIMCEDNPEKFFENIVFNINLDYMNKQSLLEATTTMTKLTMLLAILTRETQVLSIENSIHEEVIHNIDRFQREHYLREQMRVIQKELGETGDTQEEVYEMYEKANSIGLEQADLDKLVREIDRYSKMPPASQESFVSKNYLDTVLGLPWNKASKAKVDTLKSQAILDKEHYGLKDVKERILEIIAVRQLNPDVKGQIICLVGPPGIGKTSIGRSIAKSLGRKYARVSLGGIRDESDIRGHRKTYVGSMPGRIITALNQTRTNNPVILLDEIDKMSNDFRGDPSAAMLEVLDSEQNKEFRDHFIELPFDLSNVVFITTANSLSPIPAPLRDRMDVIELTSYTREEKFNIAKNHLVSKQIKKNGLKATKLKVEDTAIYSIIDYYTREAGVRNLERSIASVCRKSAKKIVEGETKKIIINDKNIEDFLGIKKYLDDDKSAKNEVGIVNGLAWTSVGGVLMPLEVLVLDGTGKIEITGSLGDVMKESARIGVSYCRSICDKYNIDKQFYKDKDLHIHAPEGATPKDGPSAGVTMVTAMISALSGRQVRGDVAMTGEITLHGKVLPIGGLKEKTMAAYKAGIKTVIIPKDNEHDLKEIDETVRASLEFVIATDLNDVLEVALIDEAVENPKYLILEDGIREQDSQFQQ